MARAQTEIGASFHRVFEAVWISPGGRSQRRRVEHQPSEDRRVQTRFRILRVAVERRLQPCGGIAAAGVERVQHAHEHRSRLPPVLGLRAVADLAGDGQRAYAAFGGVVLHRQAGVLSPVPEALLVVAEDVLDLLDAGMAGGVSATRRRFS